jgi:hypothetical protein
VAGRKRLAVQGAAGFRAITRPQEVAEQGKIISDLGGHSRSWPSVISSFLS